MATSAQTTINGYDVTLEVEDGVSICQISFHRYSASLDFLKEHGELTASVGKPHEVFKGTIREIECWANQHGY